MADDSDQYLPTTTAFATPEQQKFAQAMALLYKKQKNQDPPKFAGNIFGAIAAGLHGYGEGKQDKDTLQTMRDLFANQQTQRVIGNQAATAVPDIGGSKPTTSSTSSDDNTPTTSTSLTEHVKGFEGFNPKPYADGKQTSVGYGTVAQPGDEKGIDTKTAEARLNGELHKAGDFVQKFAPDAPPGVKQALTSLTYNTGTAWASSGLGEKIKAGNYEGAKDNFIQYNHSEGKVSPGLTSRRHTEVSWFDKPVSSMQTPGSSTPPQGVQVAQAGDTPVAGSAPTAGAVTPPSAQPTSSTTPVSTTGVPPGTLLRPPDPSDVKNWQDRNRIADGKINSNDPQVRAQGLKEKEGLIAETKSELRKNEETGEWEKGSNLGGWRSTNLPRAETPQQKFQREEDVKTTGQAKLKQTEADIAHSEQVYTGYTGSANTAADQKKHIAALWEYVSDPHFSGGPTGDLMFRMQKMGASFGIGDQVASAATPRAAFNMLAAKVLADQFSTMHSMTSESGEKGSNRSLKALFDAEEKANITAEDDVPSIKNKLRLLDRSGNLMMKFGDLADDEKEQKGILGPSFNKKIREEVAKSRLTGPYTSHDTAHSAIPEKEGADIYKIEPGSTEALPALGGPKNQAESMGVKPGGRPTVPYEQTGPVSNSPRIPVPESLPRPPPGSANAAMPIPSGPQGFAQKPPRGPYMSAEGKLVLPNDAVTDPSGSDANWVDTLAGFGALGYGGKALQGAKAAPGLIKDALGRGAAPAAAGAAKDAGHGDWPFILKLLLGEHVAKGLGF